MSDNQNIAGSMYRQTKGTMEPEKDREPIQLSSTAADIKRIQEQGGTDQELAAKGPYPSTATAGAAAPDAPPADLGQKDLSKRGADDATAGPDDFSRTPQKAMEQSENEAMGKNAHTST